MNMQTEFYRTRYGSGFLRGFADRSLEASAIPPGEADVMRAFKLVKRRLWLLIACLLLGVGLAAFAARLLLPSYTAKALLIVHEPRLVNSFVTDDISLDTQIVMLTSQRHLDHVLRVLWREPDLRTAVPRLIDLQRHLTIMQKLKSRLIEVAFTAKSPKVAAKVANTVAQLYVDDLSARESRLTNDGESREKDRVNALEAEIRRTGAALAHARTSDGSSATPATVLGQRLSGLERQLAAAKVGLELARRLEESRRQQQAGAPPVEIFALAKPPQQPSSMRPVLLIVPAFIVATMGGIALTILLGRLDKRLYTTSELADAIEFPCLGRVPDARRKAIRLRRRRPAAASQRLAADCDDVRTGAIQSVIASVLLPLSDDPKTILVTSTRASEGKTSFALDFAVCVARLHNHVLLIDLDTAKRPAKAKRARHAPGLLDVLALKCGLADVVQKLDCSLDYLPLGQSGDAPFDLIAGARMVPLADQLRKSYECIVLNGAPVLGPAEVQTMAALADRIFLIVRARSTKRDEVAQALGVLASAIANSHDSRANSVIGTILTTPATRRSRARLRDDIDLEARVSQILDVPVTDVGPDKAPAIDTAAPQVKVAAK